MSEDADFLRAIVAAPDDDLPRLVYADYLEERGDPRAEFIRVQCQLAGADLDSPTTHTSRLLDREQVLLRQFGRDWAGYFARVVEDYRFRRGFVEEVWLSGAALLDHDRRLAGTTVRTLNLSFASQFTLHLNSLTCLPSIDHLNLSNTEFHDGAVRLFVECRRLAHLRRLDLTLTGLTPTGCRLLASAPHLHSLEALILQHNTAMGMTGLLALGEADLPRLTELDLSYCDLLPDAVTLFALTALAGRLSRIGIAGNEFGDIGLVPLIGCGILPRMMERDHHLDLSHLNLQADACRAIAVCPSFRSVSSLNLANNRIGDEGLVALAESNFLGDVVNLRLANNAIGDAGAYALADAPQLDKVRLLDLSDNFLSGDAIRALLRSPFKSWRTVFQFDNNRPVVPVEDAEMPFPVGPLDFEDDDPVTPT